MPYNNYDGPIYSVLNGKCSGQVQWVWEEVCSSGGWSYFSGSCEGQGCIPPYPSFDGVNDGDFATTVCS